MSVVFLLAILASVVSVAVGVVVWLGGDKNSYKRSFVVLSIFVCLWILSNVLFNNIYNENWEFWLGLISYSIAMFLVTELLLFCVRFVNGGRKVGKFSAVATSTGFLVGIVSGLPNIIAYDVVGQSIKTHQPLLLGYGVILSTFLFSSVYVLIKGHKTVDQRIRQQIDIILAGMAVSIVIGIFCNLLLPLFNIYSLTQLGPAGAIVFISSIAYAIVRHRLFDVRLAVVRSVAYFMSLATMAVVYFGFAFLLSAVLRISFDNPLQLLFNVTVALLLALIFQPVKKFFDKLTNRIFYRDSYNIDDFFANFSRKLNTTTDLHQLLSRASEEIKNTLKAEYVSFFIRYGEGKTMMYNEHLVRLGLSDIKILNQFHGDTNQPLIIAETLDKKRQLYKFLKRNSVEIVLVLKRRTDDIGGYVFLGPPRARGYSERDYKALETISNALFIAIQNAISVQEVKDINATLQERIQDATKELRESNAQLQRLDEAKDEFVSMASHQLRTPLTSVKGYISMVLEGDVGKISGTQRKLLGEAFTSSERMVHLINDFLNVSRLQTGKFVIEEKATDLAKVIAQEVDSLQSTAKAHELTIQYRPPSHFPILYLDEGKIRQVLMNFIDNAIYYSPEGSTIDVSLASEEGYAVVKVKDQGIGVPEAERVHLFSKFFRASNARKQRPDGTGVGLFLAKKVIAAQGGTMVFESKEGEGSTFGFRLPIKKLSRPAKKSHQLEK